MTHPYMGLTTLKQANTTLVTLLLSASCTGQGNLCPALHDVRVHHLTDKLISCAKARCSCIIRYSYAMYCRVLVAKRLQRIGEGFWGRDGGTERRLGDVRCASQPEACLYPVTCRTIRAVFTHILAECRGLEVYRTLLTKSGRIVFEVAVDYSQTSHTWKEMIRLWVSHSGINSYAASTRLLLGH